ncbi:unnamed protein product [Polarella glacialis]|uniref:Phosphodiesterase n=1 Tax=Polarella glacialis TaxID=89957 RepID=A0A813KWK0_POLGL|nr:unnamed protein product [Polarella glacialis]
MGNVAGNVGYCEAAVDKEDVGDIPIATSEAVLSTPRLKRGVSAGKEEIVVKVNGTVLDPTVVQVLDPEEFVEEQMEELLANMEVTVKSFAASFREKSAGPKMSASRIKHADESLHRINIQLRRLERGGRGHTGKQSAETSQVANMFFGTRKRRFKDLPSVVRKVMAEIRVARLLKRWQENTAAFQNFQNKDSGSGITGSGSLRMTEDVTPLLNLERDMEIWDGVNVLELDETSQQPLTQVFMSIWQARKLGILCKTRRTKVRDYITALEGEYVTQPYHNRMHAAEVTLMSYQFWSCLSSLPEFSGYFTEVDLLVVIVASAIHDVGHPAKNNDFLVKTKHDLAIRYHDSSVLENFHLATAFQLMRDMGVDLLAHNLPSPPVASLRRRIVEIVLATDMALHKGQVDDMTREVSSHENRQLLDKRVLEKHMVHMADIGHPLRPVQWHQEWTSRVNLEFFAQGDREKELGFTPIAMFDREKAPPMGKSQMGFLKFVVEPTWYPLSSLMQGQKVRLANLFLQRNLRAWKDLADSEDAQGSIPP